MTDKERDAIRDELKVIEEKRLELIQKLNEDMCISPSQVKELIRKYHGKCFSFEFYEEGNIMFRLNTLGIKREKKTGKVESIDINGTFIVCPTPDSRFFDEKDFGVVGGTVVLEGNLDIWKCCRYSVKYTNGSIFENIAEYLESGMIPEDKYCDELRKTAPMLNEYDDIAVIPIEKMEKYELDWLYGNV